MDDNKCPKCGSIIDKTSGACSNCGNIIEDNGTEKSPVKKGLLYNPHTDYIWLIFNIIFWPAFLLLNYYLFGFGYYDELTSFVLSLIW